jgi:hypothetical protein
MPRSIGFQAEYTGPIPVIGSTSTPETRCAPLSRGGGTYPIPTAGRPVLTPLRMNPPVDIQGPVIRRLLGDDCLDQCALLVGDPVMREDNPRLNFVDAQCVPF